MLRAKLITQNYFTKRIQRYHKNQIFESRYRILWWKQCLGLLFKITVLAFFGLIIIIPFYFMLNLAFQTDEEAKANTFIWFPSFTSNDPKKSYGLFDNFSRAMTNGYWKALGYTVLVTTISVIARTFFSMTVGYAFSLKKWRFKRLIWLFFLSLLLLPEVALLVGQYKIIVDIKWKQNNGVIAAMFLPFVVSTFSAFMYRNAFDAIPDQTKEAAMIDGVGNFAFFFKVALPMVKATTLTIIILTAFASWNSFSWPTILTTGNTKKFFVLSTWLFNIGVDDNNDNPITLNNIKMAGAILMILPMFIAYFVFRKKIMRAISSGSAIKG